MILKAEGLDLQRHFPTISKDFTLWNPEAVRSLSCRQLLQSEVINSVARVPAQEALQPPLLGLPCSTWGNVSGLTV